MRIRRIVLGGLAAAAIAAIGAGPAAAFGLSPAPGGVQVDLSPQETVQVANGTLPDTVAGLPHPSASSFGATLRAASQAATTVPGGRVSFTIVGPLQELGGTMDVVQS